MTDLTTLPIQKTGWVVEKPFGPDYKITSARLQKFRSRAREGLTNWDRDQRQAYGAAVEEAVLAAQRSQLRGAAVPERRPNCASGTWATTGAGIEAAIRLRQNNALLACPGMERRARTPKQWMDMYAEAMAEKEAAIAAAKRAKIVKRVERQRQLVAA